jgi:hypothetical protein
MQAETLLEKIKSLPPERLAEVEDFIDFLAQRDLSSRQHNEIAAYAA